MQRRNTTVNSHTVSILHLHVQYRNFCLSLIVWFDGFESEFTRRNLSHFELLYFAGYGDRKLARRLEDDVAWNLVVSNLQSKVLLLMNLSAGVISQAVQGVPFPCRNRVSRLR